MKEWKDYFKPRLLLPGLALIFVFLYTLFIFTGRDMQEQGRRNSFHRGDSGYFLFYRLFKKLGYRFSRWYEAEPPERYGVLVYLDYLNEDKELLDGILKWVRRGNVLLLAGIQSNRDPVFSRRIGFGPALRAESTLGEHSFSFMMSRFIEAGEKDDVLIECESGALGIWRSYGEGTVYIFPDNNLFNNRFFTHPGHAVFLNVLFDGHFRDPIYLYEYGTGVHKVANPVMILFKGNLLYFTLHLVLMGLVFSAWRGRRFGKPQRLEPFKRRSLSVHLEAVGNFYQKARALKIVESLTRKYLVYRTRQLLNIKTNISPRQLAEKIAEYTGWDREKLRVLLAEPRGEPEKTLLFKRREMFGLIERIKEYKRNKRFHINK
jgi:hypothetical protein